MTPDESSLEKQDNSPQGPYVETPLGDTFDLSDDRSRLTPPDLDVASTPAALPLCVVGIGASAGGLEALRVLVQRLQLTSRACFAIAQHLSPSHRSMLVDLLAREARLPVVEITDGLVPLESHIYVTPASCHVRFVQGRFTLTPASRAGTPKPSVDDFFESLASAFEDRSIGVILSGTGSDGARGIRAIHAAGGHTIVQDPGDAKYDGMPRAAAETGCVDFIASVGEIGSRLTQLLATKTNADCQQIEPESALPTIRQIVQTVKRRSGFDLGLYKTRSLTRRIQRRVVTTGAQTLEAYAELLHGGSGAEIERLVREMFISVTDFFRDPLAFEAIALELGKLLTNKPDGEELRIWVPGCATGEEAYSLAMLICEQFETLHRWPNVRLFATDVDAAALATARRGAYTAEALNHVPQKLADKYLTTDASSCHVVKRIRDMVIFSEHNVLRDPAFLRLDLVSCRNLLMYLLPEVQRRLLTSFAHALKPNGILFLGNAESIHDASDLFAPLEASGQIYRSNGRITLPRTTKTRYSISHDGDSAPTPEMSKRREIGDWLARAHAEGVLAPFILVNDSSYLLHVFGDVSPYLKLGAGNATLDVLRLATDAIRLELRSILLKAQREPNCRVTIDTPIGADGHYRHLIATRREDPGMPPLTLVMFEERDVAVRAVPVDGGNSAHDLQRVAIEEQLTSTREHLSSVINELESTNEELQSLNEELLSANEELQSTNEELETSNEELQSTNEELITVNEELESRTVELSMRNADLQNVKYSLVDPIIVVDEYRRVTLFNPPAEKIFALDSGAIGTLLFSLPCLVDLGNGPAAINEVIDSGRIVEYQLYGPRSYLMRIQPYMNLIGQCKGAVLTFQDNTDRLAAAADLAAAHERVRLAERFAAETINALPQLVGVLNRQGVLVSANHHWREALTEHPLSKHVCSEGDNFMTAHHSATDPLRPEWLQFLGGLRQILSGHITHCEQELYPAGIDEASCYLATVTGFGEGDFWVISYKDISEHKRQESQIRLQALAMNSSLTAITIADATAPDFPLLYVNEAFEQITGYSANEVIGQNCRFLQGSDRDQPARAHMRDALEKQQRIRVLLRNYRRDGTLFWNEVTLAPIVDNGKLTHVVGLQRDITEMLAKEHALSASLERESQALAFAGLGGLELDIRAGTINLSAQHSRLVGLTSEQRTLDLQGFRELLLEDDLEHFNSALKLCITGHAHLDVEYRVVWSDGTRHWLHSRGNTIVGPDGIANKVLALSQDVSGRKDAEDKVRFIAHHDALTGLPNRSLLRDRFQLAINHARRNRIRLALMFIDLDHFKDINDSLGHELGDALLISVADRMRTSVRDSDTICRQSGDEFIALLPGIRDINDAAHIAAKIVERIAQPHAVLGHELHVTCSAGVSIYPDDGDTIDELMRHADTAMYHAKGKGRNNVEFFSTQMNQEHRERTQIAAALRHAIERQELRLHYQPQFDVRTGQLIGIEALLRWKHPDRGLIYPDAFIGIAEESDLIVDIGDWVLREACRQARRWQDAGIAMVPMAVNISPIQLRQRNVIEKVSSALYDSDLKPQWLELELTERALIQNTHSVGELLADFRRDGIRLALDDFGTGYSSLSYLHRFPVDKLKIDKSFVATCPTDNNAAAIVRAVINLARSMKLDILAEGVETAEQLAFLDSEGCNSFQGFLSAPGIPADDFESAVSRYTTAVAC